MGKLLCTALCALFLFLGGCSNQDAGTLTGGALGGLVGSQFGSGSGAVAAGVAGTLIGGYIGNRVGKSMDDISEIKMRQAMNSGRTTTWQDDKNNRYEIKPGRYSKTRSNCREYTMLTYIDGRPKEVKGTACRGQDGNWYNK
jgi:surface antigen